jgi:hypothetical protein
MPHKPTEILVEIIRLAQTLPVDPAGYAELSPHKRRAIRRDLEGAILRLNAAGQSLDLIRQPKHVFDPTSPKVIGDLVAHTLLAQDKEPLADAVKQSFYGAGVYAIYYSGAFDCYTPISGKEHPIYVGKADPDTLHAPTPEEQGVALHTRLKDHNRTIGSADNLDLCDFQCRYLVVRSAWVETAEDLLIDWFRPVWNKEMKVCQGFGKHGDSADTRANKRSPWDALHAGRAWATAEGNTPSKKTVGEIRTDIAEHFKKHPPKV